ncbi:cullin-9 isoform X2 [Stigmatopora argus]
MAGERHPGNPPVQMGPWLRAYPEELIRQRRARDGQTEHLIRWRLVDVSLASPPDGSPRESLLMWMSAEDVYANCPSLLGQRKTSSRPEKAEAEGEVGAFDRVELRDMEEDVEKLVRRARKQMSRGGEPSSLSVTHTIHVLSAYAAIGPLAAVFKETGALNLLMELLCHRETQTRRSASKMLRALASHDAGSRAHVLLSLGRQDGIEQHMDLDNRHTLMELFAETASSEEHGISFEGVHLPQIPGKLLFSLVKRYLCVTSLMDKLNTAGADWVSGREEAGSPASSSSSSSPPCSGHAPLRLRCEFELAVAMANLISQLARILGWDRRPPAKEEPPPPASRSIFRRPAAAVAAAAPAQGKAEAGAYKTRADFPRRSAYVEYVQERLKSGMTVRMLEDYEEVGVGDRGEFRYSNDGSPPVQVYWNSLCGTYWVHWHMLEIVADDGRGADGGTAEEDAAQKVSSLTRSVGLATGSRSVFSRPPGGFYAPPYLSVRPPRGRATLSRAEWWELLFLVKKLDPREQREAVRLLTRGQPEAETDEPSLLGLSVTREAARELALFLERRLPPSCPGEPLRRHALAKHLSRRDRPRSGDDVPAPGTDGAEGEDLQSYPDGLEEKIKVFDTPRVLAKKTLPEKVEEVLDMVQREPDPLQTLAAAVFIGGLLEDENRSDSAQSVRDKVVKLLVELLGSSHRDEAPFALGVTRSLLRRFDWRVSFATEGGVKALLKLMRETPDAVPLQRLALATLNVLTSGGGRVPPATSEPASQMILEIFASIVSAAPEGSEGPLAAIPAALELMLKTSGCAAGVCDGLQVVAALVSHHKSLASQFLCGDSPVVLLMSDKSALATAPQVYQSTEVFYGLLRLMEQQPPAPSVHLSVLSILNKLLDQLQEDDLPWHDSVKPCLASMSIFIADKEVVQQLVSFLYRLTCANKDHAVVMCRLGAKEVLAKAQEKHGAAVQTAAELRDAVADCRKYADLYDSMTASVLAGCIQMVLGQIEEHRRSREPIDIPFFDIFLRNLCQGSGVELSDDKCWEKVEVSSNHHRANKLSDKNGKTYWESNGPTGSHFINIFLRDGVLIRQLAILVAAEDSSYMPARILVWAGDDPRNVSVELNTVNVPASASRVVLLENVSRFWPVVQIRVKRCQQGGIDTRVHGFEILGPKNTFWPVFKEQLCRRTFLFYSTKARSWCQEVTADRSRLLRLFDKLNGALEHEQTFAEGFLPDAEAAEALGRTCWEALVAPVVRAVTAADSSGSGPLSWLLAKYLDEGDSGCRPVAAAVALFSARVRRLTQLLVHVDDAAAATTEPEPVQPPVKPQGKEAAKNKDGPPSSSVKPEEKNGGVADVAFCWQGVVQRQVKSFLEQSCEREDFVERYLSLYARLKKASEELFGQRTAFALALRRGFSAALVQLSILGAMRASERFAQYVDQTLRDDGGAVAAGGSRTPDRLQRFLEPALFLSGLELANTFEHFYRYYLADRLLAQSNVWLEAYVAEQLGPCFPNRFPQQMLKNLSESAELRRHFGLHRLQRLDLALHGQRVDDEDAEEYGEESVEEEEEPDVEVLVLSPRCWSVPSPCLVDEPRRRFPPRLCSYLEQFAHFYSHGQRAAGGGHREPGTIQWTWLGHAEVAFGSLTLHVSTLQMVILLGFNTQEEVSGASLADGCGLPEEVLLHALRPLTEDGPLRCSLPTEPLRGDLRVSPEAMPEGPPRRLELQPPQTYLNVDRDAAATLETKRNVIYCLIVSILKQEKEIHVDNLVYQVLRSCRRGKARGSPGGAPLAFSCSTGDVLSCVMHVMSKGCVRRHPERPHLLQFLPDDPPPPYKGHAQLDLRGDSAWSPSGSFSDGAAADCALFSGGRSMTPDEVSRLMHATVRQVADALSVDPDRAEHLLVHYGWDADLLARRYTDDPDGTAAAAGLGHPGPGLPPDPGAACPVCLVLGGDEDPPPSLACGHYCCRSCWREYLSARIEQNLVSNCNCPIPDCRAQPTPRFFLAIVADKDTLAKYEKARLRGYVESCSNLTWCTNPQGCDQILCKENMGDTGTCSKCGWSSCFTCNFPEAHYPASCGHMSQWMDDGGFYEGMSAEAQSKHLAKLISKRCPSCQAQIEKNEGCLHMTCAKCNHGFCWRCLKAWKPTHKDYYNCSATVSKVARHEKKFQDFNERCAFQHRAKDFAVSLERRVSSVDEALQMKSLTFVVDACKVLARARKVLGYACVYAFYNQDGDKMDVVEQQTDALDLHTNSLQILLVTPPLFCGSHSTLGATRWMPWRELRSCDF